MELIEVIIWALLVLLPVSYLSILYGVLKGYREGLKDGGKCMIHILVKNGDLPPKWLDFGND